MLFNYKIKATVNLLKLHKSLNKLHVFNYIEYKGDSEYYPVKC